MDIVKQRDEMLKGTTVNNCQIWEWEYRRNFAMTSSSTTLLATTSLSSLSTCQGLCFEREGCSSTTSTAFALNSAAHGCGLATATLTEGLGPEYHHVVVTMSTCYGKFILIECFYLFLESAVLS